MDTQKLLNLPYVKFVKLLNDEAGKAKVQALIKSGREDGFPDDEKISFSKSTNLARNLVPCQQQLLIESSIKWTLMGKNTDTLKSILSGKPTNVNDKPILTLNGKYILDGHHRWVEAYLVNPNSKVVILDMKLNVEPIDALKIIQLSIAANKGEIPSSTPHGTNMYTVDENEFKVFVEKNVTDQVLVLFNKSKSELADYLWTHLEMLKTSSQPIKNAPDRVYMPQPSKAKGSISDLQGGEIDFKKPFVKKENRIPRFDDFM